MKRTLIAVAAAILLLNTLTISTIARADAGNGGGALLRQQRQLQAVGSGWCYKKRTWLVGVYCPTGIAV